MHNMILATILFIIGLVVLIIGAEGLVRGASSMAFKLSIPPIVIGLTIVAFGTSAPELVVNILSAMKGSPNLAIGNIIGSNIANILLILGISALILPLSLKKNTVWKEIPLALLAVLLVYIMGNDVLFNNGNINILSLSEGIILILIFVIFLVYIFALAKSEKKAESVKEYNWPISIILTIGGLIGLFFGGKLLVDNAILLARLAGMSESLIGLTIVAIGTSLPELVTSVVAALHKQDDIAVGNIVGSNIFNVFWILGLTSVLLPLPFDSTVSFDVLVSIGVTLMLFAVMFIGNRHKLDRWQGALFIISYFLYIGYLIQRG